MTTNTIKENAKEIPIRMNVDVLVCGGGIAGTAAAISAARLGAKVLLVEQNGFPGGTNTASWVSGVGGWQYDLDGMPLIAGLPAEIMYREKRCRRESCEDLDQLFQPLKGAPDYTSGGLGCFWLMTRRESMKQALEELLLEAGVKLLYHTSAVHPIMDGKKVIGAFIESKSGREAILAKTVIDATGDGDIAARAGADFSLGREEDGMCQPMTEIFTAALAGEPHMHYSMNEEDPEKDPLIRDRYRGAIKLDREHGYITLNPNDMFCSSDLIDPRCPGLRTVNFTRMQRYSALDAEALTHAEIEGRQQVLESIEFIQRHIHGAEQAFLLASAPQLGIRESRRIIGDYVLTGEDIQNGTDFVDTVVRGIYLMDRHNPAGNCDASLLRLLKQPYSIPFRCMLPTGLDGIMVAGRCISGDHLALSSYRIQSHCFAMGDAAGVAAALAGKGFDGLPRNVPIELIQQTLIDNGANLGPRFRSSNYIKL